MTTIDGTPTLGNVLAFWFTKRLQRSQAERARAASNRVSVGAFLNIVRLMLHLAAFSSLTYSAFLWDKIPGFVALGFFLLVLSKLLTGNSVAPNDDRR